MSQINIFKYFTIALANLIFLATVGNCGSGVPPGRIVFVSNRGDSLSEIFQMRGDGHQISSLFPNRISSLTISVSPDGKQIAFTEWKELVELHVINMDGTNDQILFIEPEPSDFLCCPVWSPDGKWIVFHLNSKIMLVQPANSEVVELFDAGPANVGKVSWSPDGARLAFASSIDDVGRGYFFYDIYTINFDGSGLRRLTNTAFSEGVEDWSPDGTQLLIHTDQEAVAPRVSSRVYLLSIQTGETRPLITDPKISSGEEELNASFSPGGQWVALNVDRELCIVSISGELWTCLDSNGGEFQDGYPDWVP